MENYLMQHAKGQVTGIREVTKSKRWKVIYAAGFLVGFLLFAVLGKGFVSENGLLDVDSLRQVKDAVIDKAAFLQYIFRRRILWLLVGVFIWWWGYGKWYIYGLLGISGFAMGACLQAAMMQYSLKGIVLWIFLYFPQVIFYAGAFLCGIILCTGAFKEKAEKVRFLVQNGLTILLLAILYGVGIYCEGYLNVVLLQNYLQFF